MSTSDKQFLVEVLLRLHSEQGLSARHHEEQRSSVTTIFMTVAAALLGLLGALWDDRDTIGNGLTLITVPLMLIGLFGYILTVKLFERSMVHFTLAEGYLDQINALMEGDAERCFANAPRPRYAQNIDNRLFGEMPADVRPFEIQMVRGHTKEKPLSLDEMARRLARHNPLYLRDITMPIHNDDARFPKWMVRRGWAFAKLNLWTLWQLVYAAIVIAGAVLTLLTIVDPRWLNGG